VGLKQPVKAIFFDFDGTLADDGDSISDALTKACDVVCRRWPELNSAKLTIAYRQISDAAWGDYDRHLRHLSSPEAMLAAVWNQTLGRWGLSDPTVEQEAAETYGQQRLHTCQAYPDAVSVLQSLAGRFHLSVLTNGAPAMQRAKLAATGLVPFFQQIFVGGEFARGKPAPAIFRAALEAAGCQPQQAVHIGDSLTHDMAGAQGVGIHSIWLNRREFEFAGLDRAPDFEISNLTSLVECLKQISNED
jgi:putative hydrolase of the HAD superfamily